MVKGHSTLSLVSCEWDVRIIQDCIHGSDRRVHDRERRFVQSFDLDEREAGSKGSVSLLKVSIRNEQ